MINEVALRNVKCFAQEVFPINKLNIFTGLNGAGKSTVIQSLLLIAQSNPEHAISLNGFLYDVGDYSDFLNKLSNDDGSSISISTDSQTVSWGYESNFLSDQHENIYELPIMSGDATPVEEIMNKLVYLSAERWGPRINVPLNKHHSNEFWLGKHGEFTIEFLHKLDLGQSSPDVDASFRYMEKSDPRRHRDCDSDLVLNNINAWMTEISPNVNVNATVLKQAGIGFSEFGFSDGNKFKATNVGFGLSYALGIVTALVSAKPGSTIIIENPEAHLHPSGQSRLGQLIALTAKSGTQLFIETH
eukprot:CAMPEP_0195248598 /NCGR_PEP_ID=MMETSP0706-20130129/1632_1 /TAXON_ID=33640 /ORGANISM="Asterionellopsis glacialis, Strain CCMP134" /LENGTH=301 /DNA_ID=CAMNT_0040300273 /DNA_START=571 /DNA_END=1473 /DNA_ORIENTATION=+